MPSPPAATQDLARRHAGPARRRTRPAHRHGIAASHHAKPFHLAPSMRSVRRPYGRFTATQGRSTAVRGRPADRTDPIRRHTRPFAAMRGGRPPCRSRAAGTQGPARHRRPVDRHARPGPPPGMSRPDSVRPVRRHSRLVRRRARLASCLVGPVRHRARPGLPSSVPGRSAGLWDGLASVRGLAPSLLTSFG